MEFPNRLEMINHWVKMGQPRNARYKTSNGLVWNINPNLTELKVCELVNEEKIQYIPPEPVYVELDYSQAVDLLLKGLPVECQHKFEPDPWEIMCEGMYIYELKDFKFRIDKTRIPIKV